MALLEVVEAGKDLVHAEGVIITFGSESVQLVDHVINSHRCPHNGVRFRSGPSSPGNTQQDATTGASRKMEAQPRLATGKTSQVHKGRLLRTLYGSTVLSHLDPVESGKLVEDMHSSVTNMQARARDAH